MNMTNKFGSENLYFNLSEFNLNYTFTTTVGYCDYKCATEQ